MWTTELESCIVAARRAVAEKLTEQYRAASDDSIPPRMQALLDRLSATALENEPTSGATLAR
jgi:hypothetical protein